MRNSLHATQSIDACMCTCGRRQHRTVSNVDIDLDTEPFRGTSGAGQLGCGADPTPASMSTVHLAQCRSRLNRYPNKGGRSVHEAAASAIASPSHGRRKTMLYAWVLLLCLAQISQSTNSRFPPQLQLWASCGSAECVEKWRRGGVPHGVRRGQKGRPLRDRRSHTDRSFQDRPELERGIVTHNSCEHQPRGQMLQIHACGSWLRVDVAGEIPTGFVSLQCGCSAPARCAFKTRSRRKAPRRARSAHKVATPQFIRNVPRDRMRSSGNEWGRANSEATRPHGREGARLHSQHGSAAMASGQLARRRRDFSGRGVDGDAPPWQQRLGSGCSHSRGPQRHPGSAARRGPRRASCSERVNHSAAALVQC